MECSAVVIKEIFTEHEITVRQACRPKDYDIQQLQLVHGINYNEVDIDIKCISVEDIDMLESPYSLEYNPESVDGILIENECILKMFEAKEISDSL